VVNAAARVVNAAARMVNAAGWATRTTAL